MGSLLDKKTCSLIVLMEISVYSSIYGKSPDEADGPRDGCVCLCVYAFRGG